MHTERVHSFSPGDNSNTTQRINDHDNPELQTFQYTEHNLLDMEHDIDPDNYLFNTINNNCCYYTDEQYNQIHKDGKLSIIHINSRSLYANFASIKDYVNQFKQSFNIVAISETWINAEKGVDFELEGFEFVHMARQNKGGGGVAIYVDRNITFKVLESMSMVVDNMLECISIELCKGKNKPVIISCIYRTPGSNIELIKEWMEEMFTNKSHKTIFICGDFNIDLLNPNKHKMTDDFINTVYSMSLYPKITRPSRITLHCATLIDNIFTNDIVHNTISGLLISDISDHLPVFTVYDNDYKTNLPDNKTVYRRVRTEVSITALKNDLMAQNWDIVYNSNNINSAYDDFLKYFKMLYDKNCPVEKLIGN